MKNKTIIIASLFAWLLIIATTAFFVFKYIEVKSNKLHRELRTSIISLFENQHDDDPLVTIYDGFFGDGFNGYPVRHYQPIIDPSTGKTFQYKLNWDDDYPNEEDEGWNIVRVACYPDYADNFLMVNTIFPDAVQLKITGSPYLNSLIQSSVEDAYDYYVSDLNSPISSRYGKDIVKDIWSEIKSYENEYFHIAINENSTFRFGEWSEILDSDKEIDRKKPVQLGSVNLMFSKVFIKSTQSTCYSIKAYDYRIKADRNRLLLYWLIGLSLFYWFFLVLLIIKHKKKKTK